MNAVDEIAMILIQSIKSMGVVLNILWNTGKYITIAGTFKEKRIFIRRQ
jgi:hypothetical protein